VAASTDALRIGATNRCKFQPDKPFDKFTEYFVDVSPRTHRICAIIATAPVPDEEEAWRLERV